MHIDYSELNVGQVYYGSVDNDWGINKYFFKYLGEGMWTGGKANFSTTNQEWFMQHNVPYPSNTNNVTVLPWPALHIDGTLPKPVLKARSKPLMRCLNPV